MTVPGAAGVAPVAALCGGGGYLPADHQLRARTEPGSSAHRSSELERKDGQSKLPSAPEADTSQAAGGDRFVPQGELDRRHLLRQDSGRSGLQGQFAVRFLTSHTTPLAVIRLFASFPRPLFPDNLPIGGDTRKPANPLLELIVEERRAKAAL